MDAELHSLVKSIPKIIASNSMQVSGTEIADFVQQEAGPGVSLEQLSSKVEHELNLAESLAQRRLSVHAKVQERHPAIADDVWGCIATQTNIDLGDRVAQFQHLVNTKKKALVHLET